MENFNYAPFQPKHITHVLNETNDSLHALNTGCCFEIMSNIEVDCRTECCVVKSGRHLLTFQKCLLPPSSGRQVGQFLQDFTAQYPRRSTSSYPSP
jgi:hypothetical protein